MSLKVTEFAFTGYPVTDLPRARAFYESVLNLVPASVFGDDKASWIEYEVGPHTLAITNMNPEWRPGKEGAGVALEVEDFETSMAWLKEKNVTFNAGPFETPMCHMALIDDPDGNTICIHKRKPAHP